MFGWASTYKYGAQEEVGRTWPRSYATHAPIELRRPGSVRFSSLEFSSLTKPRRVRGREPGNQGEGVKRCSRAFLLSVLAGCLQAVSGA